MNHSFDARPSGRTRFRFGVLSGAAAAMLLLAGCQGSGTPTGTGTTIPSTETASATPTAVAAYKPADANGKAENVPVPYLPALAKENSKEGLEAFVRYWFAAYSYASETGDLSAWAAVTDTKNSTAAAQQKAVELNYADGSWMAGGEISTSVVGTVWAPDGKSQLATVQVIQDPIQYHEADGSVAQPETPASNYAFAVTAAFQDQSWRVVDSNVIVG
ncbi:DUF6318 family protein [Pseudarthrobacter sp. J64]|uniref:DUF6318 family protein n=1 Tax=Pseudarthrobacter sp. J64 TaxID=3116485 RepID=UPI002E821A92|nr:DUF6318 family protein [Pseudarthrobacter sp. J64]MEE2570700.1 DUF6318 family protein [Pseudarthrobacter sp. J64]